MYGAGVSSALHYLDDFLFFGEPGTKECANNLGLALATCRSLGVPVAEHKIEGPVCCMTFLGIEMDTIGGCLRFPKNKLRRLCELLREWSHKRACTKRELLSLVGLLHHAATVVKPGRMFVRRLIDLSAIPKELHFHVRLNKDARLHIWWCVRFIERWNGQGLLTAVGRLLPSVTVQSDASGGWSCVAVRGELWLQVQWPASWADVSIAPKELALIVFAALVFGRDLQTTMSCFSRTTSQLSQRCSEVRAGICV